MTRIPIAPIMSMGEDRKLVSGRESKSINAETGLEKITIPVA